MSAIPFATPEKVPGLKEVYDEIERRKRSNRNRPKSTVSNMGRVLGHSPEALLVHQNLTTFVLDKSVVPEVLRVLIALQTAASLQCPYIFHNNTPRARKCGLSDAQLQAIAAEQETGFDEKERAVLAYCREAARREKASDETVNGLLRLFDLKEVSEIILAVATYHLIAAIVTPLGLEFDAHDQLTAMTGGSSAGQVAERP